MAFSDSESTKRLVCDEDLDKPEDAGGPVLPGAAMFSGEAPFKPSTTPGMPFVGIGTSDYAVEWFIKGRPVSTPFDAGVAHTGLVSGDSEGTLVVGMRVGDGSSILTLITVVHGFAAPPVTSSWTPANWTHVCISADRAGLVTLYMDGVSSDTEDISSFSGTPLASVPVHPMAGGQTNRIRYDSLGEDHNDVDSSEVVLSSFAIHARQLTPTEIADNSAAKVVGLYAETFVHYLFSTFVDGAGAAITPTQETAGSSISLFPKFGLPSPQDTELFVPIGTPGDVFIEDTSGNGRHWPLDVQAAYSNSTLNDRGVCGFATTGAS